MLTYTADTDTLTYANGARVITDEEVRAELDRRGLIRVNDAGKRMIRLVDHDAVRDELHEAAQAAVELVDPADLAMTPARPDAVAAGQLVPHRRYRLVTAPRGATHPVCAEGTYLETDGVGSDRWATFHAPSGRAYMVNTNGARWIPATS